MSPANGDEPDPLRAPDARSLLRRYGIRPRKSLGQHFLVDDRFLSQIVAAAELTGDDVVLEVGPGLGVLTSALTSLADRVIAVELDPEMRAILADQLSDRDNLSIVAADILHTNPASLLECPGYVGRLAGYKVVANLPYYITSAVLRHLLEAAVKPERLVVMLQREVADRIVAEPGDLSILAVGIQLYTAPSRVVVVPREAFYPRPNVDSAVLRLDVYEEPCVALPPGGTPQLFSVVRAGFGLKRKQLRNSISAGLRLQPVDCGAALEAAGVDPRRRAQTLTLEEWSLVAIELESRGLLQQPTL